MTQAQPLKRKLIEVALPLEAINVASAREKSIRRGHPSTLHLWWSRKPLATCRAVLFASLVDDPSSNPVSFPTPKAVEVERTRLFGIIERLVEWENSTNEAVLEEARTEIMRSTGGNPPSVLDPFCGGGSIPLEAQRLGLTAYASDLNPVAVLITKALIEIPPTFARLTPVHPDARRGMGGSGAWNGATGLAEDVRRYAAWMRGEAERRIGHLYPPTTLPRELGGGEATIIASIWARTVTCPNPACGAQMPLTTKFALSTKKGKAAWVEPVIDRVRRTVRFEVRTGTMPASALTGTATVGTEGKKVRSSFTCLVCSSGMADGAYIDGQADAGAMGAVPMAMVADGPRARVFLAPDDDLRNAVAAAVELVENPAVAAKLPVEPTRGTFASNAQGRYYGLRRFRDYFSPRQLLTLATLVDLVGEVRFRIRGDATEAGDRDAVDYANAIAMYLALAIDRSANTLCTLARWTPAREQTVTAFSRQAIQMAWDYPEVNPFSEAAGGYGVSVDGIVEALKNLPATRSGYATQADAMRLPSGPSAYLVSTDPPYYDNIGYSDLSDFFYVWLRRCLSDVDPDLFGTVLTPKSAELIASPYRFAGSKVKADEHFEAGLGAAFARMLERADPTVPVTIYYAFKQSESDEDDGGAVASTGWETMLEALLSAGFAIDGTWPIRSELSNRMVASGTNALASSIVLVCRGRSTDAGIATRRDFVASLKREMPRALRDLQHGNIAPVDLAQSAIGPGMAVFSQYSNVLEPDGTAMRVRTALSLINQVLDEILAEQEGEFDTDTRWAVAWYDQYGMKDAEFGVADVLARAKNTSVQGMVEAGIVSAGRGKVRLLARDEYDQGWDPAHDRRLPAWEAAQRLVHVLLTSGEGPAGELLAKLGGVGEAARDLAYRLYQVSERKGWADEARAYNALVVAWSDLSRGAAAPAASESTQPSLGLE